MELLNYILAPSGFVATCFIMGFLAWFHRCTRRLSYVFIPAGAVIYLLLSTGPVSYMLLKPLEFEYDAYKADIQQKDTRYIVVMSAYALDEPYYPVSSKVNSTSLFRLVEAFSLWRTDPSKKIIVTGHSDGPGIMRQVLLDMGVPPDRIMIENQSTNSFTCTRNVGTIVQDKPFVLVTSAGHMPRSMAVFRKLGMNPIPAPTDYQVGKNPLRANWFPSVGHLYYSELAIHEFLGLFWYRIRGLI